MNTILLQYAVEVERTGSITQAAANLYMDQPNLSKAIKTLEENLGAPVFRRTSKGVVPTDKGRIFLQYAKNILEQIEEMEELYRPSREGEAKLRLSIPRATYISTAFARLIERMADETAMDVWLKETNWEETLRGVECGEYHMGIIRFPLSMERYCIQRLKEMGLAFELVLDFSSRVLMSASHPLAGKKEIFLTDLESGIEIVHGDGGGRGGKRPENKKKGTARRIYVFERGSQFVILRAVKESYMWVSPMPREILSAYKLEEKICADGNRQCLDVLVYREGSIRTVWEKLFLEELRRVKEELLLV